MIEMKRCYDCGRWFNDELRKKSILCPACASKTVTGRYIRTVNGEDDEVIVHCPLPRKEAANA